MSILQKIINDKRNEVEKKVQNYPLSKIKEETLSIKQNFELYKALKQDAPYGILAEIKKASPSKGIINEHLDPVKQAKIYADAKTSAISVLTDYKYFKGELSFIDKIRESGNNIPILRKDFFIDEYQIYETLKSGANAILLIVSCLEVSKLESLMSCALGHGLSVIIEVHTTDEYKQISHLLPKEGVILGVNNRDLNTFETSFETTRKISELIKEDKKDLFFISESGIFTAKDISTLQSFGSQGFLIGESLSSSNNPGQLIKQLREGKL